MKSGIRSLSYNGVTAKNPPNMFIFNRDPTFKDYKGYQHGDLWINELLDRVFVLTSLKGRVGRWRTIQTAGGGDDLQGMKTDDGLVSTGDVNGEITVSGGSNIETKRIGANEYEIKTPASVTFGGSVTTSLLTGGVITGLALVNRGVVRSTITGTLYASKGNDGQVLVGKTGADSEWANITAGDGIVVTNGANTIEIAATSGDNDLLVGTRVERPEALPAGSSWLKCDGSAVSKATYGDLYSVIGDSYLKAGFVEVTNPFTTDQNVYGVAHNKQLGAASLWIVGGNGRIGKSTDEGLTWTEVIDPIFAGSMLTVVKHNGLAAPDGMWVMIDDTGSLDRKVFNSADGITWTAQALVTGSSKFVPLFIANNGKPLANNVWMVGGLIRVPGAAFYYHAVFKSIDNGVSWTESYKARNSSRCGGIAYKNDVWLTTSIGEAYSGDYSQLITYLSTDDGASWSEAGTRFSSEAPYGPGTRDVIASDSTFVGLFFGSSSDPFVETLFTTTNEADFSISCPRPIGGQPESGTYVNGWFYMTFLGEKTLYIARTADFKEWENLAEIYVEYSQQRGKIDSNGDGNPIPTLITTKRKKIIRGGATFNTAALFQLPDDPDKIILF